MKFASLAAAAIVAVSSSSAMAVGVTYDFSRPQGNVTPTNAANNVVAAVPNSGLLVAGSNNAVGLILEATDGYDFTAFATGAGNHAVSDFSTTGPNGLGVFTNTPVPIADTLLADDAIQSGEGIKLTFSSLTLLSFKINDDGHTGTFSSGTTIDFSTDGGATWTTQNFGAGSNGVYTFGSPTVASSLDLRFNGTTGEAFYIGSITAVPEPSTYALMAAGLGALGFMARRRKQA